MGFSLQCGTGYWSKSLSGQRVSSFGCLGYATRVSLVVGREGWPMLTVETEANGNSRSSWLVHGLVVPVQEIFSGLGCSSCPVQNIFFRLTLFQLTFVPIAQQAGQAVVLGRLSLNVSLGAAVSSEPVFVNVYGAQESILPGRESIPGLVKKSTNTG
jgi:hypothetical protein